MIEVEHISKSFRVPVRKSGLKNAIKALFKREYRIIQALDDITLSIKEGEMVGYIGPNGAGKSTTIKILSGILQPDQGSIRVNGIDPFTHRKEHAQTIGVVFGQRTQLWWDLPVGDSFELIKDIYKIPQALFETRLSEFISLFELEEIIKSPVRQLSLGQRVRCDIVASLLHNPKILFLDEPTIGLDAHSKRRVRELIKTVNAKYNTTVILTTHDMQDIEEIASRIILIGKGSVLYEGTVEKLIRQYSPNKMIDISFVGSLGVSGNYEIIEKQNGFASLKLKGELGSVIKALQQQVELKDIEMKTQTIDDIILNLYEDYAV